MELVKSGVSSLQDLVSAGREKLLGLLKHALRVDAFLKGAASSTESVQFPLQDAHCKIAAGIGRGDVVSRCYKETGVPYERAIFELLRNLEHIETTVIDNGTRQNCPDLQLKYGDFEVLLECKTVTKAHGLINKEEAWAVIQKAADFAPSIRRVTLGKPYFDETCKSKVVATQDLTLVENEHFIEAVLRVLLTEIDSESFMKWLCEPGLAELERLRGRFTYLLR